MCAWQVTLAWRRFVALNQRDEARKAVQNLVGGNVLILAKLTKD
jgi:hypothetical protein